MDGYDYSDPLLSGGSTSRFNPPGNGLKHIFNLVMMSTAFLGIFSAFGATQNLVSSIIPGIMGYWSVASIYVALCFGALFISPYLTKVFKPRLSLVLGSITYAGFMVANLWPMWTTLIPSAVLLGIGASVLWTAQGTYITACSFNYARDRGEELKSAMGLFNGIFWAIFQCTQVIGNLLVAFILGSSGNSEKFLFYVFLGIAGFGSLLLCFLRPETTQAEPDRIPLHKRILDALFLVVDRKMIFLLFSFFYSGIEQGFIVGDFTNHLINNTMGTHWIGFVMAAFGAVDAISSFILGKLSDKFGKKFLVVIGFLTHIVFHGFWIFFLRWKSIDAIKEYWYALFISAGIYGMGDAVWNTFPNIMMSYIFTEQAESAFAVLKLFNSLGFAASFFYGPYLTFELKEIIASSILVASVICLFILDRFIVPLDSKQSYQKSVNRE